MTTSHRRARRGEKARRDGRRAEILCALWLMAKGYRILGLRLKTPQAEIDVLACKGDLVAVVEVKRRNDLDAALDAVTARQRTRLLNAARSIAARRPDLSHAAIRLDLVALAPGRWPRHIRDAWRDA
ncbi:MAG TPA: YraN family protein [Caulobacteraceae bacterium]